jgi:hypothetical protein
MLLLPLNILSVRAVRCHSSCMEDGRAVQLLNSGAVVDTWRYRETVCVYVCCDRLEQ